VELSLASISRSYGPARVLDGVSLTLTAGRVVALVGENGAGKSTAIRVASGLAAPDAGEVRADGVALPAGDAAAAIRAGVGVVHQHFMLVPALSVADNVALGAEPRTGPLGLWVDRARVRREVRALSEKHALPVDPDALVSTLSVGERQRVEILKVLYRGARALLLDEPTAVLSPPEVRSLLETVRALARDGAAVLLVSHKLDEVFAVADEIVVLRRGRVVLAKATADTSRTEVAEAVVGTAHVAAASAARAAPDGRTSSLELQEVCADGLGPISLRVAPGEVLGVAGVEGNGQRALAEVIAGLEAARGGHVRVGDVDVASLDVAARRALGVGYVPEDREGRGLVGELSIAENVHLGDPAVASREGRFDRAEAERAARAVIERFGVRPADPWARVRDLSGGNQQKVLLGRELARSLRVLVVAQPTRGVDLGASADIHGALLAARDTGVAVLLLSSELDELRRLSDRIVVMRRGAIVGELSPSEATDARLGDLMVGGSR
jgi:ABC-type uncharacterized transport system ATPase subunit